MLPVPVQPVKRILMPHPFPGRAFLEDNFRLGMGLKEAVSALRVGKSQDKGIEHRSEAGLSAFEADYRRQPPMPRDMVKVPQTAAESDQQGAGQRDKKELKRVKQKKGGSDRKAQGI